MKRRQFLRLVSSATVLMASPYVLRVRAQAPAIRTPPRSARDRLEEALARIADPKGEGARACLTVYSQKAREAADAADARARSGVSHGPLDGAIVSIKDLFDVAGEPTRAGAKVLVDAPPAAIDAPVVRRLRAAGSVIIAKTNMTEFAFSGIGLNPRHRERLATRAAEYDPFVRARIESGLQLSAADYVTMVRDRTALVRAMDVRLSNLDGLVLPTTPIVAPTIAEVSTGPAFAAKNGLVLRNPALVNFFDLCAISLPLPRGSQLPVGLMLIARQGQDRRLFQMAAAVERLFSV